jgi:hypothetical protein
MGGNNMVQEFPDDLNSTNFYNSQSNQYGQDSSMSPGKKQMQGGGYQQQMQLSKVEEKPEILFVPTIDYGRDYYELLRKIHKERTQCADPSKEELYSTFKILKGSYEASQQARAKPNYTTDSQFQSSLNPYQQTGKVTKQISKETQVRLAGSAFKDKTSVEGNQSLSSKLDLVKDRDPDSVRFTINQHHEAFNIALDLFRKEEHGILKKRAERKKKQQIEEMKKKQEEIRLKHAKQELYA